ncbi:MAG TPA: protein translocase subunit SecF [Candidatus Bathyarchaeia archaeon]|nr:protein translocase subunit SecF [Candidatus Bathyarchaeia archaeon]
MNFMRFKWLYFVISALFLIPGIYSLVRWGFKPSIDFAGGALLEYRAEKKLDLGMIEDILKEVNFNYVSLQESGEKNFLIKSETVGREKASEIKEKIAVKLETTLTEIRFETVGPTLGRELLAKTLVAVILASITILAFVGWRFRDKKFGVCAILAMFHDTLILLGSFSLLGHFFGVEIDTLFVTAVLTILSFSVHDTVVVYDRIRESQKLFPKARFEELADKAVTETLVRSLNNSFTIIFMLVALLLMGGATVKWFVIALLIGTVAGTYSSTFTAVPLLVIWEKLKVRRS